jgi:hypothetical protein
MLQELSPSGALVWQWLASDHFDAATESTFSVKGAINGTTVVDVFHCNSIAESPTGDLLVSARSMDAVFQVSKATSKVVWKLGGAPTNKDGATILAIAGDPQTAFYRQHDARFLANGNVTLFDDHTAVSGTARGVQYAVDVANARATFVAQYGDQPISQAMGSFRLQSDGSSIVGWGLPSTGYAWFTELNAAGAPLVDAAFATQNYSYRAIKVPTSQLDLGLLRKNAGAGGDAEQ